MGRVRKAINTLISKAEDFFAEKEDSIILPSMSEETIFEMTPGKKMSDEEIIEENKFLIATLDSKVMFLINLIEELTGQDALQLIAEEPINMQQWLAHIAYSNRINDFNFLISGKSTNTLDPNVLVKQKHRKQLVRKNIKCLTDLPLQKSLLN